MTADAFAPWPEPAYITDLRTQLATAQAALAALAASVAEVIAYADRHDGRAPVGTLRAALAEVTS